MKNLILGTVLVTLFPLFNAFAADMEEYNFKVLGVCGSCKARIEKAVKSIDGVNYVSWDSETHKITVKANDAVDIVDVYGAITKVGHTVVLEPSKKAYDKLPGCCKYTPAE